jgi:hypothetical protein
LQRQAVSVLKFVGDRPDAVMANSPAIIARMPFSVYLTS